MDNLYLLAQRRMAGWASLGMFSAGWGNDEAIQQVRRAFGTTEEPTPVSIRWTRPLACRELAASERDGVFDAPAFSELLAPTARQAHVKLILPAYASKPSIVVVLPRTHEEGYGWRMGTARALAARGIGSVLLEAAYLGRRRAADQRHPACVRLSDFVVMCGTAAQEARSIATWFDMQGFTRICLAGVSKGGYLAAAAGATMPSRVAIASVVAPQSGLDFFRRGAGGRLCNWAALRRSAPAGSDFDEAFDSIFSETALSRLPLKGHASAVGVGALHDRIVPGHALECLKAAWPTMRLRWARGGHVTSIHDRWLLIGAIQESIEMLDESPAGKRTTSGQTRCPELPELQ